MQPTIYHNPRCSKSRATLDLLRERGVEPIVVEYLKTPPSAAELKRILGLLGLSPRDILRPIILHSAYGFILAHNHPSGDPSPSKADRELTRRLRDAAANMQVRFVDHVIIGRPATGRQPWFSFRESGEL